MKRTTLYLDEETRAILDKYLSWGTPYSALVRKAVKTYESGRNRVQPAQYVPPEETAISYD